MLLRVSRLFKSKPHWIRQFFVAQLLGYRVSIEIDDQKSAWKKCIEEVENEKFVGQLTIFRGCRPAIVNIQMDLWKLCCHEYSSIFNFPLFCQKWLVAKIQHDFSLPVFRFPFFLFFHLLKSKAPSQLLLSSMKRMNWKLNTVAHFIFLQYYGVTRLCSRGFCMELNMAVRYFSPFATLSS